MPITNEIRTSLSLLSRSERRRLVLVTLAQMSTSFLDLVGVILIGVLTALALTGGIDGDTPAVLEPLRNAIDPDGTSPQNLLTVVAVMAVAALLLKTVLSALIMRKIYRFLAARQVSASERLAAKVFNQSMGMLSQRTHQETAFSLTSGVGIAVVMILGMAVTALAEISVLVVLAVVLFVVSPLLTLTVIIFFSVVALGLNYFLSSRTAKLNSRHSFSGITSNEIVHNVMRNYKEVATLNRQRMFIDDFAKSRFETSSLDASIQFAGMIPKYVFDLAFVVSAIVVAGVQFLTQSLTVAAATLALFLAAATRMMPAIMRLQGAVLGIRGAAGAAAPTFELMQSLKMSEINDQEFLINRVEHEHRLMRSISTEHHGFSPRLHVESISMLYPGRTMSAVDGVTFSAEPGQAVALIGNSGSGKSTLCDILLGLVKPTIGEVTLSGASPETAVQRWPGAIAYVPQEVNIVRGTVRANVAMGFSVDLINDEWVWEALTRAHLREFVESLPAVLDEEVGEFGTKLSGGQRQRLGIARALYSKPKMLVMDESTSALDASTEQALVTALRELHGEVSTVTVAHRLSTIRDADVIVYMQDGRATVSLSFDELLNSDPNLGKQADILGMTH